MRIARWFLVVAILTGSVLAAVELTAPNGQILGTVWVQPVAR